MLWLQACVAQALILPSRPACRGTRRTPAIFAVTDTQATAAAGFAAWWEDADDEVSGRVCSVEGSLPEWLRGRLVRNGPGKWTAGDKSRSYTHAFDGLAKLVAFEIRDGAVQFSTRFLRTDWHARMSVGKIPPSVTTGPVQPAWTAGEAITAALTGTAFDNTPVNLHRLGGSKRWMAVTDAPPLIEFDPTTLETVGRVDGSAPPFVGQSTKLGFRVPGTELFSTAHPQHHPVTGETFNYHLELRAAGGPMIHIVATSAREGHAGGALERRIVCSAELEKLGINAIPYVHSFGVTENYVVLVPHPLTIPFDKLANGKGFLPQLEWDPSANSKVLVWNLNLGAGRAPSTWKAPPCWAYHVVNAYDEKGVITVDLVAYESAGVVNGPHAFAYLPNMKGGEEALKKQERDGRYLRLQVNDLGDPTPTRQAKV